MVSPLETWASGRRELARASNAAGELLPTWQVGHVQPYPDDVWGFAKDGYSQSSVIYACVKEKATSFAPLQPVVERVSGQVIKRHRVLDLLNRPNSYQDGAEFGEVMATHFDVAGNVYIEKVRQSANRALRRERRDWPVQELSLIRPDYVTIQPGSTRDEDLFVVTIGGQVRRRIARADMIHIRQPNLINDFYGLSPIALIAREASTDLSASDQELAFFRNAGVPFGLLYVKGRKTQDQIDETKSRFRQAFSGFKRWFDLLVLNMDESKYEQLASKQTDMGTGPMRDRIEARISSTYGVPPVIVGLLGAVIQNPDLEAAEHQFWAETMVPFAGRFARSFTQHLLSEFALVADAGAKITYDFTSVRALQEDRSRKLREVVRMINTGAFTVNQALTTNGLPAVEGGDFYLRTGNQVEMRIAADGTPEFITPPAGGNGTQQPNPANPLEGAAAIREVERIFMRTPAGR